MKKILVILLSSILLTFSVFSFTGCADDTVNGLPRSNNLPDFADCEVGYKLEVYPKIPFNYELPDGTIVHIDSIEATLTAKNEINEGDTIKEYFYPYEVTIKVTGTTDIKLADKSLYLLLSNGQTASGIVSSDGVFLLQDSYMCIVNNTLFFNSIGLS